MKYYMLVLLLLSACAAEVSDEAPDVAVSVSALNVLGYPLPLACQGHQVYGGEFGAITKAVTDTTYNTASATTLMREWPDPLYVVSLSAFNQFNGVPSQGWIQNIGPGSHLCVLADYTVAMTCSGITYRTAEPRRWYAPGFGSLVTVRCPGSKANVTTTIKVWGTYTTL